MEEEKVKPELEGNVKLINLSQAPQSLSSESTTQNKENLPPVDHISTIEEPITSTLARDLRMIFYKMKYVLMPRMREERGKELRKWDLWGPLILCLLLALTLSFGSKSDSDVIFATIFVIIWAGAAVVTINARFLGGKISFFQTICVLGYCVCPLNIGALLIVTMKQIIPVWAKIIVTLFFMTWSVLSSIGFMSSLVEDRKKLMAVYPVCLFYIFIGWYVAAN